MIYSVFAGMCYYAYFTSCVGIDVSYDDYETKQVEVGFIDESYCNWMYHDREKIDSTCHAICTRGDFYSYDK